MPCGFTDVHLEIHSSIDAMELVQVVAEHIARKLGLDEEALHWTVIAVRETVVNAIVHGNDSDPDKLVFIDFTASPKTNPTDLMVRVRDQGRGFDSAHIGDPRSPENVLKASGRGIFLIRQFMDDVSIQRAREGGMEVRMLKRIRG
ncbi:MAG: ATP-binding protein [Acidobacteria bacterium]|nr:ATP-binding protein [Acidobacteriota bacterium]